MQRWTHTVCQFSSYLVFSLDDSLKQTLLSAIERKAAWQEDEEDDSTPPHIHWLAIRLPLHNLGGHEVWSPHSPWREQTVFYSYILWKQVLLQVVKKNMYSIFGDDEKINHNMKLGRNYSNHFPSEIWSLCCYKRNKKTYCILCT